MILVVWIADEMDVIPCVIQSRRVKVGTWEPPGRVNPCQ